MNQEHIDKNIIARKRKARRRKAHLRRLQAAYDRLINEYILLYKTYREEYYLSHSEVFKKKWYQFWK